jgi:pimeloyl-ACP methyl ester carboxylesterase
VTLSTLIFIHGAGTSADFWHEQWEVFTGAIFLDLPGHGERKEGSSIVSLRGTELGIEAFADAVAGYVEREGITGAILNGHSMGGAIALTLALRKPRWLRGLILTGTGARLPVSPTLLELLRTDYPAAVERIAEWSFPRVEGEMSYAQRIARNGTRRKLLRTPQAVTLASYESCDRFDVIARLGEIEVPTLVIVGSHDRMTRPTLSEELHAGIPRSRLCIVEGTGHMLPLEKPDEYNEVIRRFEQG